MEKYKEKVKDVMVIGHKNPDTDSICSAVCYANLKNKITGTDNYVPKRAGHINEETHFVLKSMCISPISITCFLLAAFNEPALFKTAFTLAETSLIEKGLDI